MASMQSPSSISSCAKGGRLVSHGLCPLVCLLKPTAPSNPRGGSVRPRYTTHKLLTHARRRDLEPAAGRSHAVGPRSGEGREAAERTSSGVVSPLMRTPSCRKRNWSLARLFLLQ
jgi:hypothetical protein